MKEISLKQYDEEIVNICLKTKVILNEETREPEIVRNSPNEIRRDIFAFNTTVKIVKENKEKEDCE